MAVDECAALLDNVLPWLQTWLQMPMLQGVAVTTTFWACVLFLVWRSPLSLAFKQQGADRMMSICHTTVSTCLGVFTEWCAVPGCSEGHSWVRGPLMIMLGYIVVDFVSMLVTDVWKGWRPVDRSMLLHHSVIICMFGVSAAYDVGVYFASSLLINEASTLNLTAMWYLTYSGRKSTKLFAINGVIFAIMFFLCRIVFIPVSFYQFTLANMCYPGDGVDGGSMLVQGPHLMVVGYIFIFLLNLVWFRKLAKGALKMFRGSKAVSEMKEGLLATEGVTVTAL
ncbi:unnamed protein product [Polarella glacialis]|uniref:TLC domain-containing protein n=1 Tax=Polarella glacialis TaxID=89957 RepID=A0A813FSG7_POLGL|nr:unnamed protein product [Polarella glacialis]CAE8697681.1 unnamed protein product [Polarella glacialis]